MVARWARNMQQSTNVPEDLGPGGDRFLPDRQEVKKAAETKHQKEEGKDIMHFPFVAEDREPEGTGMN